MTVKTHENGYGTRWFTAGPIKIVLRNHGNIDIGHDRDGASTAHLGHSISIEQADIDDLDEVLTYVQRIRKEGTAPLVQGIEPWRDIAADMIRAGRDPEAQRCLADHGYDIATERDAYLDAVNAFITALEQDQRAMTGLFQLHDTQVTWMAVRELRAIIFADDKPDSQPDAKYNAMQIMESARTALRDAAWRYINAGQDITIGLELDAASLVYADARRTYEKFK